MKEFPFIIHCNPDCNSYQCFPSISLDITKSIEESNLFLAFSRLKRELNRIHGLELGPHYKLEVVTYRFYEFAGALWVQLLVLYADEKRFYFPAIVIGPRREFFDAVFYGLKTNCPYLKDFEIPDLYKTLEDAVLEVWEYPERKVELHLNMKNLDIGGV